MRVRRKPKRYYSAYIVLVEPLRNLLINIIHGTPRIALVYVFVILVGPVIQHMLVHCSCAWVRGWVQFKAKAEAHQLSSLRHTGPPRRCQVHMYFEIKFFLTCNM